MTITIEELRSEESHAAIHAIELKSLREKYEDLIKINNSLENQIVLYKKLVSDIKDLIMILEQ